MSDDIVTRLRAEAKQFWYYRPLWVEAADEIERLRSENDGLRVRIYSLLNKLDEQAVRG